MNAIPGRKIILKGNHDYWWTTLRAFDRFCAEHGFADFHVLNNSCFFYGDIALCGTRGWFYDAQKEGSHDEKISGGSLGGSNALCSWRGTRKNTASCTIRRATAGTPARRFWSCSEHTA